MVSHDFNMTSFSPEITPHLDTFHAVAYLPNFALSQAKPI